PNLANVAPPFLGLAFDPGNRYTVPYQWGTTGIGYHADRVDEVPSWADLFEHDRPEAWLADTRQLLGVALLEARYDPDRAAPDGLEEAKRFLIDNGRNVVYIAGDDGQEMLARGEVDMVVEYSGDIFQVMDECECDTYGYVIPAEGANFWVDSLAIPRGAPN